MTDVIIRYLHFIGIMTFSATLVVEYLLLKKETTRDNLKDIIRIIAFYGISAVVILITGLLQWFWVGKPAEFYNVNMIFHIKITLFIVIAILSIFPTIHFLKMRKQVVEAINIKKSIFTLIQIELYLLILITLMAVLITRYTY